MIQLRIHQWELTYQVALSPPVAALIDGPGRLASALVSQLEDFDLGLSDVSVDDGDGSLDDKGLSCELLEKFDASILLRADRFEIHFFSMEATEDEKATELIRGTWQVLNSISPQINATSHSLLSEWKIRNILSGVDWKWYLYRDIEPRVPALDLLRGVFIAERPDHLQHSRRVLHESHSEVALMATCMDRDGAIFLQVPIPLCPGAIHRQEPQRVFLEDEPNGYLDRAAGAPADDGYGDLAALLERLSKSILSHRVHSRLHHNASHTPAGPRFEADRMRATPILAAKLPNRTFRFTGDRRCACRRQERRRFGFPSQNRESQAM